MGFDDEKKAGEENEEHHHRRSESEPPLSRHASESSIYATEDDDDEVASRIQLGPQCTLKEHLEKDKDDESLRRWKEQLLGSVDVNNVAETLDPEVKITSLSIISPDRGDIVLPVPESGNPKGLWFTLKKAAITV
uniref:Rho GDP-dissociation inhibitor 1 n=1 Tax=Lotus japonicus TaxID=34305 RepID=I3SXK3_LOTJA|nr:unknown [Lotus japonicus]